jgi:hypothetical protein
MRICMESDDRGDWSRQSADSSPRSVAICVYRNQYSIPAPSATTIARQRSLAPRVQSQVWLAGITRQSNSTVTVQTDLCCGCSVEA